MTMIIIGLIFTLIYGGFEIVNLVAAFAQQGFNFVAIEPYIEKIAFSGIELAILCLGYKAGKDFIEEEEKK